MDNYKLGSWSFTGGCAAFTYNALKQTPKSPSLILGCTLFNVGCGFFLMDADKKNYLEYFFDK